MKKQYIHELLKDGEYRNKVRETMEQKLRKRLIENGKSHLKQAVNSKSLDPIQADPLTRGKTMQNAGVQGYDENSNTTIS